MVKFSYGPKVNYDSLAVKDADTLYFLTDTLQVFRGTAEYTKSAKLVQALPSSGQVQGVVYVRTGDFTAHVWNGVDFVPISVAKVTAIPASGASNDNVPTTKAVADYVTGKIAEVTDREGLFVTEVSYAGGTLSVAKNGEAVKTVMTGVVNNPTYDSTTRKITLPVYGGKNLVIELGRDAFVDSGAYNTTTKCLELVLTSGDKVTIPVESLIDVYTGLATPSVTVTVSADNKISANVKLSATANNALTIEEDGLYVGLPDAYTKAQTDAKIKVISDSLATHTGNAGIHVTAAQKTAWDAKATAAQVATAKSEAISAAATDATSKANKALGDAKTYADGLNTTMSNRVAGIENTLEWKAI